MRLRTLGATLAITATIGAGTVAFQDARTVSRSEAKSEQDAYYAQNGTYRPRNEAELSKGINVQTYDGPKGKGYIVIEESAAGITVTDFGMEGRSYMELYQASSSRL